MFIFNEQEKTMQREEISVPKGVDPDMHLKALYGDPADFADVAESDVEAMSIVDIKEQ